MTYLLRYQTVFKLWYTGRYRSQLAAAWLINTHYRVLIFRSTLIAHVCKGRDRAKRSEPAQSPIAPKLERTRMLKQNIW